MKKPVELDGVVYPTKKDLRTAIQSYVAAAPLYTPLWDSFPYAIFDRHPHREEKTGCGLRHIDLRLTEYGNRGFYAVRTDGTDIDFSWQVALDFAPSGPTLAAAAREAIRSQIETVAIRNASLHVHHEGKPFRQLLNEWLAERGGDTPELIHGALHDYFKDPEDALSWTTYHLQHAVLRLVSVEEHKQLHGKRA